MDWLHPAPAPLVALTAAVGYFLLCGMALAIGSVGEIGPIVWLSSGWALGLLLVSPRRQWRWLITGFAAAEVASGILRGLPGWIVACSGLAAVVGPLVGAYLVRRSSRSASLVPTRRLWRFLTGGALLGPILAGAIAALGPLAVGDAVDLGDYAASAVALAMSAALGVLVVTPLMLSRRSGAPQHRSQLEVWLVVVAVALSTLGTFWSDPGRWAGSLPFLVLPALTWTAIRFGVRGTALSTALVAPVAVLGTAAGHGAFAAPGASVAEQSLPVHLFLLLVSGGALALAVVVEELQQRDAIAEVLYHAATHDALTDLPNRVQIEQDLLERLAEDRASGSSTVAMMCDIDHFKTVNDSLGHQAGDALLVEVADGLRSALRRGDLLARLGGDEFVAVTSTAEPSDSAEVGTRVINALQPTVEVDGNTIRARLSVGLAVADPDDDPTSLLRKADAALYEAKASGRSRMAVFGAHIRERLETERIIERDLSGALSRGEIQCAFQAEVFIESAELFGFEALARWEHPEHGTIMPGRFVPIVERMGRSGELFEHTLDQALAWQSRWSGTLGFRPPVSVNMSSHQLGDAGVVHLVEGLLARHRAPADGLWIEVTESALMAPDAVSTLGALKALGVRTAIDDFGTGWASLERLAQFDWDVLKIDQCFVASIDSDHTSISIISAVIALAHALDTLVVAEGVETSSQLQRLRDLGCDIVQGYSVARPAEGNRAIAQLDTSGRWTADAIARVARVPDSA
ncbi:MAG: EAL domain-containing protein [Microthrixaceae bacterium]